MSRETELPVARFNDLIRHVKHTSIERVTLLERAIRRKLDEISLAGLAHPVDKTRVVAGMPTGSDHHNSKSIIDWINSLDAGDDNAIQQLLQIEATCHWRLDG